MFDNQRRNNNNHHPQEMTLVLPLVATGNVPQLSVDLILHSFNEDFQFIETLDSKYLHPFLGPLDHTLDSSNGASIYRLATDHNNTKLFSSALELFSNKDRSVYIIQQRTPVIQGYINNFIIDVLVPLIDNLKIKKLSILDSYSIFDTDTVVQIHHNNNNISIGTCNVHSINDVTSNLQQSLNLHVDSNLHYTSQFFKFNSNDPVQEISTDKTIFKIMYHLLNEVYTPLLEIKYFTMLVHEGDNSLDAKFFVRCCLPSVINGNYRISDDNQFKVPLSWLGVYGMAQIPSTIEDGIYI